MSIKSSCYFKYWNGELKFWQNDCFCGSKKEQFSSGYGEKYCCVHQPMSNSCQIDISTNEMWCPNATLLSSTHTCNNNCYWFGQEICPSNPEGCMDLESGCDGRERCEAFCAGPLEDFPYYNQTARTCLGDYGLIYPYCGKRDEAKYHNHQCISYFDTARAWLEIGYYCLNRNDVSENTIRNTMNYNNFVSARKNLFPYFKDNDTRNQITGTHIICGNQKVARNCDEHTLNSIIECKKEERDIGGILVTNRDVCNALDLLEDKGLPPPSERWLNTIYLPPQQLGM